MVALGPQELDVAWMIFRGISGARAGDAAGFAGEVMVGTMCAPTRRFRRGTW